MSWPLVKLSEVAQVNPRLPKDVDGSQEVVFLPMASVSENAEVLVQEKRILNETKKGFTYFEKNDVVIAKITPCFENGKAAYLDCLETQIGFGTTEFHVIRPNIEKLDGKYLFYLIWSDKFRHAGARNMSGSAGQKRVPADFLKNMQIPLPPLAEQKRIAAILDKADAIRQKRKQAIQLADDFLRSVFLNMFGDPASYSENFNVQPLGIVCKKITDGEHGTVKRLNSGKLYLMARNVTKGGSLDLSDVSYVSQDDHDRIYKRCGAEENDLLLVCVGATIGKATLVPKMDSFSLARSVALIKPDFEVLEPVFLLQLIKSKWMQQRFINSGNSSAQAGLYLGKIKEMGIPVPSIHLQRKFVLIERQINAILKNFEESLASSSNCFNSLSQKAFAGEL